MFDPHATSSRLTHECYTTCQNVMRQYTRLMRPPFDPRSTPVRPVRYIRARCEFHKTTIRTPICPHKKHIDIGVGGPEIIHSFFYEIVMKSCGYTCVIKNTNTTNFQLGVIRSTVRMKNPDWCASLYANRPDKAKV